VFSDLWTFVQPRQSPTLPLFSEARQCYCGC